MTLATTTSIQTVSAPVGGGKTYAACRHAIKAAKLGRKLMMVQPSIVLIEQTERALRGLDSHVRITALHSSGDDQTGVVRQIMKHLAGSGDAGEILLITQIAFDRIAFVMRRSAWHVIYDEMPQIDYSRDFKLPANGHLVLQQF